MSCQRACTIIEIEPEKWYVLIADDEYGEEHDQAFGPFKTRDDASYDLRNGMLSNPGGWFEIPYDHSNKVNERDQELISKASKSSKGNAFGGMGMIFPW
jgi:hypothetical protein